MKKRLIRLLEVLGLVAEKEYGEYGYTELDPMRLAYRAMLK
jgi:hypothetical protein